MAEFISDDEWEKTAPASEGFISDEEWNKQEPEAPTSQTESLLRGAAQGATGGFADELAGAASALYSGVTSLPGGSAAKSAELAGEGYVRGRDESRAAYGRAAQDNPLTYSAGDLAGTIGSAALLPGGALAKGVAYGAGRGLGSSTADLTKGDVAGAVEDTAKGAVIGALPVAAAKGIRAAPAAAGKAVAAQESVMKALSDKFGDNAAKAAEVITTLSADAAAKQIGLPPSTILILKAILGKK